MMPRQQRKDKDVEELIDDPMEDEVDDEPPSIDPYAVLGLETEATADDVKKAYRKLALKHHPDKASELDKSTANKKFQEIAFAYAVLSDEHRRKRYDLTGSTAETLEDDDEFDWLSFYRQQFEDIVTEENIKKISDEYKGSAEERSEVLKAYTRSKGNLDKIYGYVMLSDILEDDDRFREILDEEIEKGTIETYPAYERQNNDIQREKAKARERKNREEFDKRHGPDAAEKAKAKQKGKKNNSNDLGDLAALIQQRQKSRMGGFFDQLELKYSPSVPKSRGNKRATPMDDEPTEEEFLAAKEKLNKRAKTKRAMKKKVIRDENDDDELEEDIEESEVEEEESTPPPKTRKSGGTRSRKPGKQGKAKA